MKSAIAALLLLVAMICATAHAKSYPVLHCVNDRATAKECKTDVKAVVQAMQYWFEPYMTDYNKEQQSGNGRRQLLDCTRFCEPSITYFTVHAPCDCTSWRRGLSQSPVDADNAKTALIRSRQTLSDLSALEGPIQIYEYYTTTITDVKCKEVFLGSKCVMNFVNEYSNEIRVNDIDEDEVEDGMSQDKQNSLVTHFPPEGVHNDPLTGEVIDSPVPADEEDQSYLSELHPNPDTGDPLTDEDETNEEYDGEKDYGELGADDSGSFRNPITGKTIDPETGEDIDDVVPGEDEEFNGP